MNDITRIFRSEWISQGQNPESAYMDELALPNARGTCRAVFVNSNLIRDWGSAYLASERAMNAAVQGLRGADIVAIGEVPQFSPEPGYVISAECDGLISVVWINCLVALESESAWNRARAAAAEEVAILDQAKNGGTSEMMRAIAMKDQLRRQGRLSTIAVNELREQNTAASGLLKRWGIK